MALAAEISTRTVCAGETPAKTKSAAKKVIWQRNSSFMEFSQKGYCYDLVCRKQLKGEFLGYLMRRIARNTLANRSKGVGFKTGYGNTGWGFRDRVGDKMQMQVLIQRVVVGLLVFAVVP